MKSARKVFRGFLSVILLLVFAPVGQAVAQTWTQLSPVGGPPAVRILHTAVSNPTNNRMIVFGGLNGPGDVTTHPLFNDVWVLSNADGLGGPSTWTQLSPTGGPPSARAYHSAAYDPVSNRMMVFAGDPNVGSCFGAVNDSWVLTNADGTGGTPHWTQLSPSGGPPPLRQGPTAVYDSATNRMVVFGGGENACGVAKNDVWVLENANGLGGTPAWTQLFPTGGPPPARGGQTAVYDAANNTMIVFSGCASGACPSGDVWVLQNANGLGGTPAWTQLFPTGGPPPLRWSHTAVYDQATNRMTVFGGAGVFTPATGGRLNDVWVLEDANGLGGTPNWTQLFPTGGPPSSRDSHTAVYNPVTNRMVAFAGRSCPSSNCSALNDVWVLSDANGVVEIADETAPTVTCPVGSTTSANANCLAAVPAVSATVSDNVTPAGSITLTQSPRAGTIVGLGTHTITVTATDAAGNSSQCTTSFTVVDDALPAVTCAAPSTARADANCQAPVPSVGSASDSCPGAVTVTQSPATGTLVGPGTYTITVTATDAAGNQSTCTTTFTVVDTTTPEASCIATTNPSGNNVPYAGNNPKSGQNPDGFYQLFGKDNCTNTASVQIFVKDSASSFVAGPYAPGTKVKITQAPGATPNEKKMAGEISAHITLNGDALVYAVDSAGNQGAPHACLAPPPPK